MRKRRQRNKQTDAVFPLQVNELESLIKNKFENNSDEDLIFSIYEHQGKKIAVFCLPYLIDTNKLESALLDPLRSEERRVGKECKQRRTRGQTRWPRDWSSDVCSSDL